MIGYIYTLTCSKTNNIIYVGKTTLDVCERAYLHYCARHSSVSKIGVYLRKIKKEPTVDVVERIVFRNFKTLELAEYFWIEQFRQWGFPLLNVRGNINISKTKKISKMKVYDYNGKEVKLAQGKNIKISNAAWNEIRKYCFMNGLKMGKFTQDATLEAIKSKKKL